MQIFSKYGSGSDITSSILAWGVPLIWALQLRPIRFAGKVCTTAVVGHICVINFIFRFQVALHFVLNLLFDRAVLLTLLPAPLQVIARLGQEASQELDDSLMGPTSL